MPGHVSTLTVTDPELIEVFDNFAFDEVLRYSRLDLRTRLMVQLAALIGCQALSEYQVMLGAALANGVTPVEAREIVYQAVPSTGMGRAFDFLHATNDILTRRGIPLPLPGQAATTPETRAEHGRAVQEKIADADRYHATKWGIEGFAESVAQEVTPFGIGVTIVEPGGARTEFRYGSAQVADPLPAYDGNPAHSFQAMLDPANGLAPSDPARMAAAIIASTDQQPAPLRIILGSQALKITVGVLKDRIAGFEEQADPAASTDFPPGV